MVNENNYYYLYNFQSININDNNQYSYDQILLLYCNQSMTRDGHQSNLIFIFTAEQHLNTSAIARIDHELSNVSLSMQNSSDKKRSKGIFFIDY